MHVGRVDSGAVKRASNRWWRKILLWTTNKVSRGVLEGSGWSTLPASRVDDVGVGLAGGDGRFILVREIDNPRSGGGASSCERQ